MESQSKGIRRGLRAMVMIWFVFHPDTIFPWLLLKDIEPRRGERVLNPHPTTSDQFELYFQRFFRTLFLNTNLVERHVKLPPAPTLDEMTFLIAIEANKPRVGTPGKELDIAHFMAIGLMAQPINQRFTRLDGRYR